MWLGRVGLVDTGLNWKPRILSSIFPREVFQISAWKYLYCVQQEVFGVFIFPYFVLSWYILAQRLVKTFPKWKYFFSFSIFKLDRIVQTNRKNKLSFKDEHSYKYSSVAVNFFLGAACFLQNIRKVSLNWKISKNRGISKH